MIAVLLTLPLAFASDPAEAYRTKDYSAAMAGWQAALEEADSAGERARLAYNLGNAAYRKGDELEAVAWYTASLRLRPRDADTWHNLELARAEAELDPADRGDLASTSQRLVGSLTRAEAEWLLLLAIGLFGVALAFEALRGGQLARRIALVGLIGVILLAIPYSWHLSQPDAKGLMVVQKGGAHHRSEPRTDAKSFGKIEPGTIVHYRDELPGWVGVQFEGRRAWVRERALFDLDR